MRRWWIARARERSDLEVAPPSQDLITLEKCTEGETPSVRAGLALARETRVLPGRKTGGEREQARNVEHRTSNAERRGKESGLRGGAAEGAGKRRSDVGGDDDLFGRFFRFHLFAAARSDPRRWVEHAAMLDDFLDL